MVATAFSGVGFPLLFSEQQVSGCGTYYRVYLGIDFTQALLVFTFVADLLHTQFGSDGIEELFHSFFFDVLVGDHFQRVQLPVGVDFSLYDIELRHIRLLLRVDVVVLAGSSQRTPFVEAMGPHFRHDLRVPVSETATGAGRSVARIGSAALYHKFRKHAGEQCPVVFAPFGAFYKGTDVVGDIVIQFRFQDSGTRIDGDYFRRNLFRCGCYAVCIALSEGWREAGQQAQ